MVMWHCVESFCIVEAKDHEGACSYEMLLEWRLLHVSCRESTLASELGVFGCVELLFNVSSEHF